jgi:carbon monoxide dehydrogenase subunit G
MRTLDAAAVAAPPERVWELISDLAQARVEAPREGT